MTSLNTPLECFALFKQIQLCNILNFILKKKRKTYDIIFKCPWIINILLSVWSVIKIDWDAFTVTISEDELIEHKSRVPQAIIENTELLRTKQKALRQVIYMAKHVYI